MGQGNITTTPGGFDIQSILPKLQSKTPEELKAIGQRMDADGVPLPAIPGFDGAQAPLNVPGVQNVPQALPQVPELPGLQGAISPTFQGNSAEAGATPAPTASGSPSTWEQFLGDPELMLKLGADLLAPRQAGTSDLGHAVSGLALGVSRLSAKKRNRKAGEAAATEAASKQKLRTEQTALTGAKAAKEGARIDSEIFKNRQVGKAAGKGKKAPTEADKLVASIVADTGRDDAGVRSDLKQAETLQKSITAEGKTFPLSRQAREEQSKRQSSQQAKLDAILDRLYPPAPAQEKGLADFSDADLQTLAPGQPNNDRLKSFLQKYGQDAITRLRSLGVEVR